MNNIDFSSITVEDLKRYGKDPTVTREQLQYILSNSPSDVVNQYEKIGGAAAVQVANMRNQQQSIREWTEVPATASREWNDKDMEEYDKKATEQAAAANSMEVLPEEDTFIQTADNKNLSINKDNIDLSKEKEKITNRDKLNNSQVEVFDKDKINEIIEEDKKAGGNKKSSSNYYNISDTYKAMLANYADEVYKRDPKYLNTYFENLKRDGKEEELRYVLDYSIDKDRGYIDDETYRKYANFFENISKNVSNQVESLKTTATGAVSGLLKAYNSNEIRVLLTKIYSMRGEVDDFKRELNLAIEELNTNLNKDTKEKLGISDASELFVNVYKEIRRLYDWLSYSKGIIDEKESGFEEIDLTKGTVLGQEVLGITPSDSTPASGNNGGSARRHPIGDINPNPGNEGVTENPSVTPETPVEEITPEVVVENQSLIASSIGAIKITSIIPLLTTIGGEAINSSLEVEYGLLGIEKVDNTFYYKIIDKTSGSIYYTNVNNIPNIEIEYKNVVNIKERAMVLNSTEIGADNNFVKIAEANSMYLELGEEEVNGIKFANVLDSTDGNKYYIPLSDSTEVISLDQIKNNEIDPIISEDRREV